MGGSVPTNFKVCLLAVGAEGDAALRGVAAGVRSAWGAGRALTVETACAGEDRALARRAIRRWCDREGADVVLTLGACGHRATDFAPEVTLPLLERTLPGVEERMRLTPAASPEALLSRGRAGLRGGTLVVNLPAAGARARQILRALAPVLGHALDKARGGDAECGGPGKAR